MTRHDRHMHLSGGDSDVGPIHLATNKQISGQINDSLSDAVILSLILISAAVLSRLLPHPPNVTALMAISLYASWHLPRWRALLIILLSLVISDFMIALVYSYSIMGIWSLTNLLAYLVIFFLNQRPRTLHPIPQTLIASLLFWLITNFGVWLTTPLYPHTQQGLIACFVLAIPFLTNSLIGDLFWLGIISVAVLSNRNGYQYLIRIICPIFKPAF